MNDSIDFRVVVIAAAGILVLALCMFERNRAPSEGDDSLPLPKIAASVPPPAASSENGEKRPDSGSSYAAPARMAGVSVVASNGQYSLNAIHVAVPGAYNEVTPFGNRSESDSIPSGAGCRPRAARGGQRTAGCGYELAAATRDFLQPGQAGRGESEEPVNPERRAGDNFLLAEGYQTDNGFQALRKLIPWKSDGKHSRYRPRFRILLAIRRRFFQRSVRLQRCRANSLLLHNHPRLCL
jgi:hypothetical protein